MKRFIIGALLLALATSRFANAEGNTLVFHEFVREALANSPEAAKIDATLASRLADAFASRVKNNPELTYYLEDAQSRKNDERNGINLNVSQAIRPSDFGARSALSKVIEETADVERKIALNEYVQSLGILYARAWQFQEIEKILGDAKKRASQFYNKVSEGSQRGIFSEGDVELFRAEQKTFEAEGAAARGEFSRTSAELTRLSGVIIQGKKLEKPDDRLFQTKPEIERAVRESGLPIQARARLMRSLSQKQLRVAELDAFPAVSPALGYARHDDGVEQVTFGITVPLPFYNRNQAERIRSQGALASAEQEQRYFNSDAMMQEVQLIYDAFLNIETQVKLYESDVIPAKRKVVDAYYRQFDAGIGTAFQLWQAFRELNGTQLRAVELRSSLASIRAQINVLSGQQF